MRGCNVLVCFALIASATFWQLCLPGLAWLLCRRTHARYCVPCTMLVLHVTNLSYCLACVIPLYLNVRARLLKEPDNVEYGPRLSRLGVCAPVLAMQLSGQCLTHPMADIRVLQVFQNKIFKVRNPPTHPLSMTLDPWVVCGKSGYPNTFCSFWEEELCPFPHVADFPGALGCLK